MSNTVIQVEDISKLYRLGQVGTGSLSHDLNRWMHRISGKEDPYLKIGETNDRSNKGQSDYAWALQEVSFEVQQGEAVGIIGRNGAGKSTLLKILSRTTTPTKGNIRLKGKVASLLEVGTGFHPDLSGRDNIFLNGAILGMRKREIAKKFDEIVAFAGVERYIDTPVKRYSSGMYVRLAFAVAAHLEPEILIVDEVLAVGDYEFQKKCLGKMGEVSRNDGRTVLFVSHNMDAVVNLCTKGIVLGNGRVEKIDTAHLAAKHYLLKNRSARGSVWQKEEPARQQPQITYASLKANVQQPLTTLSVEFVSEAPNTSFKPAFFAIDIKNSMGVAIAQALPTVVPFIDFSQKTAHRYSCEIELTGIIPDSYSLSLWIGANYSQTYDFAEDILQFEVTESPNEGRTVEHNYDHGFFVPKSNLTLIE